MSIKDVANCLCQEIQSVIDCWNAGDPHPMIEYLSQMQKDNFSEGFQHAIDVLQDAAAE